MSPKQVPRVQLDVKNVGGIDETSVSFEPGVTVLEGRNATNRTSLLKALMAALGSSQATVKGDAETGSVSLTVDGEAYTRELHRTDGSVRFSGDPYLEDEALADLFAFLLETNEARQAISRGDDLRELMLRPVDTDAIEREIDERVSERNRLEERLEELEDLKKELPKLEEKRTALVDEIETKRSELEEKRAEIEATNEDVETRREQQSELQSKLTELQEVRSDLNDAEFQIDAEQESIDALRKEKADFEEERGELPGTETADTESITEQIESLREQKQDIEEEINACRNVIRFNETRLEDEETGSLQQALDDPSDGPVTDKLLEDETVVCWTCGTSVDATQIEATIDQLQTLQQDRLETRREIETEIEELTEKRDRIERTRKRRAEIDRRLTEIDEEIQKRTERIEDLEGECETLADEIESLEAEIEDLEREEDTKLLDLHEETNELEYQIERLENKRNKKSDRIAEIEEKLEKENEIEEDLGELRSEIQELRTRVEQIESEAIDQFNTHMDAILSALNFENLERIWIESVASAAGSTRGDDRRFEVNVVRSTDSGATYTDSIEHLSESEREVTGIVFALAGYLTHEVYEEVPFLIVDSLEAIDSERIDELLSYFADYPDYLVVALLEEDAEVLTVDPHRVSDI